MASQVNLDALIPREDFDGDLASNAVPDSAPAGNELYLASLTKEGRLASLRKPAFQRETSAWKPEIIAGFIKSFVDGDVIPGMIMWRSPRTGNIFVIDGAHRLSALIAWIHDDYGDRSISREFYDHQVNLEQERLAQRTRDLIEKDIGPFRQLRAYAQAPETAPNEDVLKRSRRIAHNPVYLQWVIGDASAAESSFVRINSTAVAINDTEKELISSRHKPNGLATRAIMRAGTGHEYWSKFDEKTKADIRSLAKAIYDQLIAPIVEYPVVTLDLPAANRGYSADSIKTILDLVTYLNAADGSTGRPAKVDVDADGTATVAYLRRVKDGTGRVFGRHSGSLALHPGIYCYSETGKFIPKAFIGAVGFVARLGQKRAFDKFTKHRGKFEEFLLAHRRFVKLIGRAQGSGGRRGVPALIDLYEVVLTSIDGGADTAGILTAISVNPQLSFLKGSITADDGEDAAGGSRFTKEDKAAVLLRESLAAELRCPICNAWLYRKNLSKDHKVRREDGGQSTAANLQLTHPYCNTGFKEKQVSLSRNKSKGAL